MLEVSVCILEFVPQSGVWHPHKPVKISACFFWGGEFSNSWRKSALHITHHLSQKWIYSAIPHHHSLESAAIHAGVGDLFTKELIDGASRCNYNQAGNVNSFTDLISLAGAGVAGHVFGLANGTQVGRLGWAGQLQLLVSWKNIWKTWWFSQGMTRMPSFSSSATNCQDISKGLVKVANRLRLNDRVTEIYDAESGAWAPKIISA